MRHSIGSELVQIMADRLFGTKSLSKAMLGYCRLESKEKLQWNFYQNAKLLIHVNASDNIVCEMTAFCTGGGELKSTTLIPSIIDDYIYKKNMHGDYDM